MINNHKTQGERKIHLTMLINFISFKDFNENRILHTKSDNIKILVGDETDETMTELFDSLLQK